MELAEGQDPTQLSQEEKAAYKAVAKVKGQIWEMLLAFERGEINLTDHSDDLKKLIAEYVHLDEEVKASAIYRKKAEKARRAIAHNEHQSQMIELKKQRHELHIAEHETRIEMLRQKAEAQFAETLALEGRKAALAQWAISNGTLEPITEERIQAIVNSQRRAREGVVRIESGDGK